MPSIQITSDNYNNKLAHIIFYSNQNPSVPVDLGDNLIPYVRNDIDVYGTYQLYFADYNKTCNITINSPSPTPSITPTTTITPTPTPTVTITPSASLPLTNNGIIIQSNISNSPRPLVGGGVIYNPTFINDDYKMYFDFNSTYYYENIDTIKGNQYTQYYAKTGYLFNGKLPYNQINSSNYLLSSNKSNPIYMYFKIPIILTKYRLFNGFAANIPVPNDYIYGNLRYSDIGNQTPQSWVLYGSNDDINWSIVDSRSSQPRLPYAINTDASKSTYSEFTISSPSAYKSYKLNITSGGRNSYNCGKNGCSYDWQIGEIQLIGYENLSTNCLIHGYNTILPTAKYLDSDNKLSTIYLNDISSCFLMSNKFSFPFLNSTDYFYYWDIRNTLVGTSKTGYFAFDYPIILSSYNVYSYWNCCFNNGTALGGIPVNCYWTFYGSNDFSSWTLLDTANNVASGSSRSISSPSSYKYYKMIVSDSARRNSNKSGTYYDVFITDIALFGTLV